MIARDDKPRVEPPNGGGTGLLVWLEVKLGGGGAPAAGPPPKHNPQRG